MAIIYNVMHARVVRPSIAAASVAVGELFEVSFESSIAVVSPSDWSRSVSVHAVS